MPRLFWKFFTTIWLTLAATVGVIILLVNFFLMAPYAWELEYQKRELALKFAETVLTQDGEAAALRFVRLSEKVLGQELKIMRASASGPCSDGSPAEERSVRQDGTCYRISLTGKTNLKLLDNLAVVMPWLAILISSSIAAGALARYLIRPVVHMRDGLSALARGQFDVRIGDKMAGRKDEVTALAHDFDATAARLNELQDAQQRLFHDVSHELRSPLSRLQAAVGVLRQSPTKLNVMLDRMDREVERLDALVGEVLTLARLTAGSAIPLKTQAFDVIDLLNEILGDATFEAEAKGVSITPSVEGNFISEVEGELIYRALENVIRNAIKYTRDGSKVSVVGEVTTERLEVRVTDQGPGVRPDELERIFQPFSRGTVTDDAPAGYGLGLAITRQAVERHGGRVYASLPQAGGLTIVLEFPRR